MSYLCFQDLKKKISKGLVCLSFFNLRTIFENMKNIILVLSKNCFCYLLCVFLNSGEKL